MHYLHCIRVNAPHKDSAVQFVNSYLDDMVENHSISYGLVVGVTTADGVISVERKDYMEKGAEIFSLQRLEQSLKANIPESQLAIDKLKAVVDKLTPETIVVHQWDLKNLFHDLQNSKTQTEIDNFDVFKDTAFQGDLLSDGLTDLEEEGYSPSCYTDEDTSSYKTFFVWVNVHN